MGARIRIHNRICYQSEHEEEVIHLYQPVLIITTEKLTKQLDIND